MAVTAPRSALRLRPVHAAAFQGPEAGSAFAAVMFGFHLADSGAADTVNQFMSAIVTAHPDLQETGCGRRDRGGRRLVRSMRRSTTQVSGPLRRGQRERAGVSETDSRSLMSASAQLSALFLLAVWRVPPAGFEPAHTAPEPG